MNELSEALKGFGLSDIELNAIVVSDNTYERMKLRCEGDEDPITINGLYVFSTTQFERMLKASDNMELNN